MDLFALGLVTAITLICVARVVLELVNRYGRDRVAIERAEALLRTHLTVAEFDQLEEHGVLEIPSPAQQGRVYQVHARGGRVRVLLNGLPEQELCIRPRQLLPGREHVLAHKLMIQAAEDEYVSQANVVWHSAQATVFGRTAWFE